MENYEIGSIKFTIPRGYVETNKTKEEISSPIPEGTPTIEYFSSFRNSTGNKFFVFYWIGFPHRDGGPMSKRESWPISIAGYPSEIVRTNVFMGTKQEVLVVHCELSDNERLMVYAPNLELKEFKSILKTFKMK